jgi:catechol 2,3-dioxygenase-like lactoylglutathione lyase family enzyme
VSGASFTVEGVHHVQLAMPPGGEAEAQGFYVHVLGFDQVAKPQQLATRGGCWFRSGPLELHMGVEEGFRASTKAHVALRTRGLSALRAGVEGAGLAIEDDTQLDGHERWYVRDPFGNRLEFIEEVAR